MQEMKCLKCRKEIPLLASICPYCHSDTRDSQVLAFQILGGVIWSFVIGTIFAVIGWMINEFSGLFGGFFLGFFLTLFVFTYSLMADDDEEEDMLEEDIYEEDTYEVDTYEADTYEVDAYEVDAYEVDTSTPVSEPYVEPSSQDDIREKLLFLDSLKEDGLLDDAEYAEKKREILKAL